MNHTDNYSSAIFINEGSLAPSPVIVCIAKLEQNYIEEFVRYHLALGFTQIYLFDNEDTPTYASLLKSYVETEKVVVMHLPHNMHYILNAKGEKFYVPVQYLALDIFKQKIMIDPKITHIAHIDIDEFIVLKKHANICDFIQEYIKDDCVGIGINWRFFGSSGNTEITNEPVTKRFTMCEEKGNKHIKTIFRKDRFANFNGCHTIVTSSGYIKSTNGTIIRGPYNESVAFDVIQLNHYKCKTIEEYRYIRTRNRADVVIQPIEDVDADFKQYDLNEVEDMTACHFYANLG
jgi:hypothetical protein